jgi:hypothetical protein
MRLVEVVWRSLVNWLRYGRWTACRHAAVEVQDVQSAKGLGLSYVPPEHWMVCQDCNVVLKRSKGTL